MATEVKETITPDHGRTNHNNNINNNTKRQQNHTLTNNNNKIVVEQDERLLRQQPQQQQPKQQKHKHHHHNKSEGSCSIEKLNNKKKTPKNGTVVSVPVIETIFTDSENSTAVNKTALLNGQSGGVHHNHTPLIPNNQNNDSNHTAFKKISSPPVLKKISGNGVIPTEHGMNLPVEEIESPDISRRRKYSNNHLYVPNGGC